MKRVTIILELEDAKFNEMEKVLMKSGLNKELKSGIDGEKIFKTEEQWNRFVIEEYNKTKSYLELYDGNLEEAYEDMIYDF